MIKKVDTKDHAPQIFQTLHQITYNNGIIMERKEVNKDKLKALEVTLGKIEKDFGRGTIMKLGDHAIENVQVISTGSIGLDAALGIGGLPRGRVVEIYGPESSVKQRWPYMP